MGRLYALGEWTNEPDRPQAQRPPWFDRLLYEWGFTDGSGPLGFGRAAAYAGGAHDVGSGGPRTVTWPGSVAAGRYGPSDRSVRGLQASDGEGFYSTPTPTPKTRSRPRGVKLSGAAALDAWFNGGPDVEMDEGQAGGPELLSEG